MCEAYDADSHIVPTDAQPGSARKMRKITRLRRTVQHEVPISTSIPKSTFLQRIWRFPPRWSPRQTQISQSTINPWKSTDATIGSSSMSFSNGNANHGLDESRSPKGAFQGSRQVIPATSLVVQARVSEDFPDDATVVEPNSASAVAGSE